MQSQLSDLLPLPEYREQRQHIFPSEGSLEWFVRQHRAELSDAGALVRVAAGTFAHAPKFDECVVKIGQRKFAQAATRATQ
jgi:hypothetical protein